MKITTPSMNGSRGADPGGALALGVQLNKATFGNLVADNPGGSSTGAAARTKPAIS